jgi:Polyketide cyclase / dehydrase and lipid transport
MPPPELVWEVLSTIERWPTWNPEVQSAGVEGELAEGTRFRWKAGPSVIKSKLISVAAPTQIAWTGKSMGVSVIHIYNLVPRNGRTLVRTAESVEGLAARLFRGPITRRMDSAIEAGLEALKAEAERRAAS